jgi:hypothetical protein
MKAGERVSMSMTGRQKKQLRWKRKGIKGKIEEGRFTRK